MNPYLDLAIPIAWPDQTARGDELWMAILRKIGIVKNLNFKVGHAAIVLVHRKTGTLKYYDFGRYIVPRGFGRARSAKFDPRLQLHTKAQFTVTGDLENLAEILQELKDLEQATHGGGRLLCSVADEISFKKAEKFAEDLVDQGPILYGALAPGNNSCSRYVAQILVNAMPKEDKRIRKILFPECLKASPTSNVVNATHANRIVWHDDSGIKMEEMGRMDSLRFQIGLLKPNFFRSAAKELSDDKLLGFIEEPARPIQVPADAQWLGGLGEGCWFSLQQEPPYWVITKYNHSGKVDYKVFSDEHPKLDISGPYEFTYKVHAGKHELKQKDQLHEVKSLENNNLQIKQSI